MNVFGAWRARVAAIGCALVAGACAGVPPQAPAPGAQPQRMIVVAVVDAPATAPAAGGTPRLDYRRASGYAGGTGAAAEAAQVAATHGLAEQSAWTIEALGLRCGLYALPDGADRDATLAALARDPRVRLAQPLNTFETYADDAGKPATAADYNDPYFALQRGFNAMEAGAAQRVSRGDGVRIALIDTGIDLTHPDLGGRVGPERDFVGGAVPAGERHGTEVAGIIAAAANNKLGIVGIAPQATLLAYRACWAAEPPATGSRCDSYTLARALSAAIAAGADIVNLSLGGPRDPLLEQLTAHALARGTVVVGAVPPGGGMDGFPVGVPGVIAVAPAEAPVAGAVSAPGRDVLTLAPGGHYDYASGSSLATAHVSGAVALLRAVDPSLTPKAVQALLAGAARAGGPLDICTALQALKPGASCRR